MSMYKKQLKLMGAVSLFGFAGIAGTAQAGGFYLGADAVSLSTELDYAFGTEDYSTTHLRLKAGYEFADFLAVEAHLAGAGDDTGVDPFGDLYKFDTGNIIGIYLKPKTPFSKANVYGLIGLSQWDTTYTDVAFPIFKDNETVNMFGFGVGGEFNITKNLRFNIEGMIHVGSADYPVNIGGQSVDILAYGLAAGMSYRF